MNVQSSRTLRLAACVVAATALVGFGGAVVVGSAIGALPLSGAGGPSTAMSAAPVAAKKQLSLSIRSSWVRTRSRS